MLTVVCRVLGLLDASALWLAQWLAGGVLGRVVRVACDMVVADELQEMVRGAVAGLADCVRLAVPAAPRMSARWA